jgi:hypothetical protein
MEPCTLTMVTGRLKLGPWRVCTVIPDTLMRRRIRILIRIHVKSRIRIQVKSLIRIRIEVTRICEFTPGSTFIKNTLDPDLYKPQCAEGGFRSENGDLFACFRNVWRFPCFPDQSICGFRIAGGSVLILPAIAHFVTTRLVAIYGPMIFTAPYVP